ncbi:MAG TPA: YceI family protein [Limnochordia bacterium]|nr:YceI family protein [Limnochordia bacterium]
MSQKWVVDPTHTNVEFVVRHMMISSVRGRFSQVEGVIEGDPDDLTTGRFEATIDAASIDTRQEDRDQHLRSADFFDVENHPKITFKSTSVEKTGENQYKVTGDLTIRGTTRPVTLDVTYEGRGKDPWGNERIGLSAQGKINRKDFGLTWNAALETGGVLVSDEVRLEIHTEAVLQA